MIVSRYECQLYSSNIFVLEDVQSDYCWLIDIGEKGFIVPNGKSVKGVFITHTHIDHIQGINDLVSKYPDCVIYVNEAGKDGLFNDRINLTYYHEKPLHFKGGNIRIIRDGDKIDLFRGVYLEVVETPGHHPSCVCYKVDKYLFTGDSFIPGVAVVTKIKGGNRLKAIESVQRIQTLLSDNLILCPGHGIVCTEFHSR